MPHDVTAGGIKKRAEKMRSNWSTRDRKIRQWYDLLTLKDELAQEGMESVAGNDPRTGFNLAKHLMTSSIVAHKVPIENLEKDQISSTSELAEFLTKRWAAEEKRYRSIGRQSLKGEIVADMLATGWYSVFSMVTNDRIWTENWSPIEVYPEFGREGLIEAVHIYSMSPAEANRKAAMMGWEVKRAFSHNTSLYDYWGFDDDGDTVNGIVLGTELVKQLVKDIPLSKLHRLPLFISPVGGLPDRGSISSWTSDKGSNAANRWQEHYGEALVATNEDLTKNYNKMLTFTQQLMRDTAQPRWLELSSGESPILTEENLFKRGTVFKGSPGESVFPLPVPPIPVELRTMMFDYQNMLQRGLFPWAIFGNIQQQMSYLAMASIASAALQVLTPYMEGYKGLFADLDNYHWQMMKENSYRPHKFELPDNLPEEFEFVVQADIEIPGFLIQRAEIARRLDPNFRLATSTVMNRLFPEIQDPMREVAKTRQEDAMMDPRAIMVDQIIAYREQAGLLREAGDERSADLYEKLADSMEAQFDAAPPTPTPKGTPASADVLPNEILPQGATEPQQGIGTV